MSEHDYPQPADDPYRGQPGATPSGGGSWNPPPPPPDWAGHHGQVPPGGWAPPPGGPPGWGPAAGGWPPQGPPPGHAGWSYGWGAPRPRRSLPGTVTALLLAVAILAGFGIGHGVWRNSHISIYSPNGNNSGGAGSGTGNNGGFGFNPFGSGNSSTGGVTPNAKTQAVAADLVDINTSLSYQNGQAAGTGIVLTSDGVVLTNNHVISGATSIKATDIGNGQTYTATVVGYDRSHDIAVIRLSGASGLQTAPLGNSSQVAVGDTVFGMGNAGGVGGTPSTAGGHVIALNQAITASDESNNTQERLTGLIETDANIQPGDSGGALVDGNGKVIGVDTAASTGFSFQTSGNQGFAIPINQAVSIANQIRSGQASATVHIGPTAFLGVEVDTSGGSGSGATVKQAISGGPADQAGIGSGDTITSLGGTAVDSPSALTAAIGHYHPGDKVSVSWTDPSGQTHKATVTLAVGPAA